MMHLATSMTPWVFKSSRDGFCNFMVSSSKNLRLQDMTIIIQKLVSTIRTNLNIKVQKYLTVRIPYLDLQKYKMERSPYFLS